MGNRQNFPKFPIFRSPDFKQTSVKTNEEKQQARMNSIMNIFDNLDKALGTSLKYRSHIGPILEDTFRNFSSDFGESFKIEVACGNTLVSLELISIFRCM